MKRFALILALCLALSPAALAETSSTDRFLSNLGETWNSFLDMAADAGAGVSQWAQDSGVSAWVEGAVGDVSAWAQESGLADWANQARDKLTAWFDESGVTDWATEMAQEIRAMVEENRPAVEAWLAQAGQDVRDAWDTLLNADQHTQSEVEAAYDTVSDSLEAVGR